jgi:hypothetical protein
MARGTAYDPTAPRMEPAKSIYNAFQAEAAKRNGRSVAQWTAAESVAVLDAATRQARLLGLRAPTAEVVATAEVTARGHIDYGSKWAIHLAHWMRAQQA